MKVHIPVLRGTPAIWSRMVLACAIALTLSLSAFATTANAVSRKQVVSRAHVWVAKRVPYSQRASYGGYRRDCSGFVSMAWALRGSYTTRSLSSQGKRISIGSLKPGDAVLVKGRHVSLFVGWKNKRAGTFVAAEQTTWGSHAKQRVRKIPSRAIALRRKGITG